MDAEYIRCFVILVRLVWDVLCYESLRGFKSHHKYFRLGYPFFFGILSRRKLSAANIFVISFLASKFSPSVNQLTPWDRYQRHRANSPTVRLFAPGLRPVPAPENVHCFSRIVSSCKSLWLVLCAPVITESIERHSHPSAVSHPLRRVTGRPSYVRFRSAAVCVH